MGKYKLEALYVHVVPPTIDELGRRIRGRYREADVTIEQRIEFTQAEVRNQAVFVSALCVW